MPIITGLQICTTQMREPRSGVIIAKMEDLLDRRQRKMIGRRGFLIAWGKLRLAMFLTDDYQALITRVRTRAGGLCEFCHKDIGSHVHHIKPVAFKPRLILLDLNCAWTCVKCHPEQDRKSRNAALKAATLESRHSQNGVTPNHSEATPRRAAGAIELRAANG